ncbi:MAG: hypothetical protein ACRD3A_05110 [Terriglobales bacterium]
MHRWSQLFIPTLREAPADAEVEAPCGRERSRGELEPAAEILSAAKDLYASLV